MTTFWTGWFLTTKYYFTSILVYTAPNSVTVIVNYNWLFRSSTQVRFCFVFDWGFNEIVIKLSIFHIFKMTTWDDVIYCHYRPLAWDNHHIVGLFSILGQIMLIGHQFIWVNQIYQPFFHILYQQALLKWDRRPYKLLIRF